MTARSIKELPAGSVVVADRGKDIHNGTGAAPA
jgi:hypothetical protein